MCAGELCGMLKKRGTFVLSAQSKPPMIARSCSRAMPPASGWCLASRLGRLGSEQSPAPAVDASQHSHAIDVEDVVLEGVGGGCRAGADAELVVDGLQVPADGARADEEAVTDLGIGQALCDELEHFQLAR